VGRKKACMQKSERVHKKRRHTQRGIRGIGWMGIGKYEQVVRIRW